MRKSQLLSAAAERFGVPRYIFASVLRTFVKVVQAEVGKGRQLTISGLGTFRVRSFSPHLIRTLKGELRELEGGRRIVFTPSKAFKAALRHREAEL